MYKSNSSSLLKTKESMSINRVTIANTTLSGAPHHGVRLDS